MTSTKPTVAMTWRIITSPFYLAVLLVLTFFVVRYHSLALDTSIYGLYQGADIIDGYILFGTIGSGAEEVFLILSLPILVLSSTMLPVLSDFRTRLVYYQINRLGFNSFFSSGFISSMLAAIIQILFPLSIGALASSLSFPTYTVYSSLNDYSSNHQAFFSVRSGQPHLFLLISIVCTVTFVSILVSLTYSLIYLFPSKKEFVPLLVYLFLIILTSIDLIPFMQVGSKLNFYSFLQLRTSSFSSFTWLLFILAVCSLLMPMIARSVYAKRP